MRRRKSCRSYGEKDISEFLENNQIQYEKEKTFNECRNPRTNKLLRFDFFLPYYNLLIEYQGKHHYEPINKYYRAKLVHNKTVIHDSIKHSFCQSHGYNLLTIPYWDYKKITDIILQKLSEVMVYNIAQEKSDLGVENV